MTDIYLNNDVYPSSEGRGNLAHFRNHSTLSSATLHTNTTSHSQPTEPLLNPASPEVTAYYEDQILQQPRDADGTPARMRWPGAPSAMTIVSEKEAGGAYWKSRQSSQRKGSWIRWTQFVLQFILATWAVYNAVRYYVAFTFYDDSVAQSFSLALGTSAGVSFLLASLSFTLSAFQRSLIGYGVRYKHLRHGRTFLHLLSSVSLLGPAAVNFALIFIWRNASSPQMDVHHRCHIDIDIVWSVRDKLCNDRSPPQGVWLALSALRLVLTLAIIIAYHAICFIHRVDRRGSTSHLHLRSDSYPTSPFTPSQIPSQDPLGRGAIALSSSSVTIPMSLKNDLSRKRQISESTLAATASSPVESPTSSRYQSRIHLARSRSSGFSGDVSPSPGAGDRPEPIISVRPPSPTEHNSNNERENTSFVDRFRSLISQVTRETDDAIEFARSDGAPSPENASEGSHHTHPSSSHQSHQTENHPSYTRHSYEYSDEQLNDYNNNDNDEHSDHEDEDQQWGSSLNEHSPRIANQGTPANLFKLPPVPPVLGYNEFGMPYPPEENIRVLNGIIRRMPTIESMGSGEVASSIGAGSSARYADGCSIMLNGTGSRPPTRNTLASFVSQSSSWSGTEYYETGHSSSRPLSPAGSLSARAEYLAAGRASTSHSHRSASWSLSDSGGPPSPGLHPSEYGELLSRSRPETAFGIRGVTTPSSFGTMDSHSQHAGSYHQAPVDSSRSLTPYSLEVSEHGVIGPNGRSASTDTTISSASPSSTMSYHTATMGSS